MTTLYRPVLIESAEQAEALPIGTVALLLFGHRTKTTGGWWETPTGGGLDESRAVVGAQALVPIEAEEEWGGSRPHGGAWECQNQSHAESDADGWNRSAGPDGFQSVPVHRYVTPWEEA